MLKTQCNEKNSIIYISVNFFNTLTSGYKGDNLNIIYKKGKTIRILNKISKLFGIFHIKQVHDKIGAFAPPLNNVV